jgi:regulatory protein
MNLLQKRSYTEKQLRDKLKEGFCPEKIMDEAIEYVKSFHYVDDYQYAVDYITCYDARKSRKKLEMELLAKGVSKTVMTEAFREWENKGGTQDEIAMIQELLEKKHFNPECDMKEKNRIYGFLLRRGFSVDKVQEAMRLSE